MKDVHPSHDMQDIDEFPDPHSGMRCNICHYKTCIWCRTGEGKDDEELAIECIGENWLEPYRRNRFWEISSLKFDY
jgi:hypothetical protein